MTSEPLQYSLIGTDAASLTRSIERGVVSGALRPGDTVPSVRGLARELGLSPTTVAAAYRELRRRNVLVSHDRSRTVVAHRPPLAVRLSPSLPEGAVDLASGNPDPALLPDLEGPLREVVARHHLYGSDVTDPGLDAVAREDLEVDALAADHLAVVGGGLDGIERVLEVHCRVGDRIAIEDPGYVGTLDLVRTLGLHPVPVAIDDEGMLPDALVEVLDRGIEALIHVPRAQNPYGSALSAERAAALRAHLDVHPDLLVIEDDHAAPVSGQPRHDITDGRTRWAAIRSLAKPLGPDLRVAIAVGDADTITRVLGRQRLGTGWVSHILQGVVAATWRAARDDGTLARATTTYDARRDALLTALVERGIGAHGDSGFNVWIPVGEESAVVQGLLGRGWAVQAGDPYRMDAGAAVRVTTAALPVDDAPALADDLAAVLDDRLGSRRG